MPITRRELLAALSAGVSASPSWAAGAEITIGITSDTRPDWNGADNFIRSINECSELGYHWIETFWGYVSRWGDRPQ